MTRITVPNIPKGNLGKVYVFSEKAALALFEESSESIRKYWLLGSKYIVPSIDGHVIKLESSPSFTNHSADKGRIGIGSFGIGIGYEHKTGRGSMTTGCGKHILEFLCEVRQDKKHQYDFSKIDLAPNSHVFVYGVNRPTGIVLPDETLEPYKIVSREEIKRLNEKVRLSFENIVSDIERCLERRGAILTRGWLDSEFVL